MDEKPLRDEQLAQTSTSSCSTEEERQIPFCCVISVPHGFQPVPYCKPKLVYNLSCLGTVKETCRKIIQVDDCGQTEIDLHILKVKGCISFLVNIEVEPTCERDVCSSIPDTKEMILSCEGTVCVDHIIKCSVDCLPDVCLDCENILVSDLQVQPICEDECHFVKVTGYFQLDVI
ncbi:ABC transporter permease [Bacillus thuringiensis]|uniref:ABC transporter permease n=1 Tax=Bacillus thuringiensis TaxID=1428 RepID=UPI002DBB22B9|nr:ABC transporter permease [Bacillus thuringiensis]MEC2710016.1 ABC transporter permease [Bacillus thuringiensis]